MKVKVFRRSENEWVDVFGKMQFTVEQMNKMLAGEVITSECDGFQFKIE